MIDNTLVDLSRLQFAVTAIYHFLFVPLTIGLAFIIAIMESVYVMTSKIIWKKMTKFWSKLFAINFAMGVATGITMEFQFGTNWAYYSHYVGDIFGVPLALEGLMAFFLESTFVGLMLYGWDRLSKLQHLLVTWLTALGANLSALWILVANGWMQNPVGAEFNPETIRMELTSIYEVFFNIVAQAKFVHTVSAGYVVGSMFVLSISAFYILKKQEVEIARRSIFVAASFGLLSALSVMVLGDESGYTATLNQKSKIAALEAMWETEKAPADLVLFGIPDQKNHTTHYTIKVPYLLGLIATRSFNTQIPGINELIIEAESKIKNGLIAYKALSEFKENRYDINARDILNKHFKDLGYALLLKKQRNDIENASVVEIKTAAQSTIPNVLPLFWSFRIMVGLGIYFIILFAIVFYLFNLKQVSNYDTVFMRRLCYVMLFSLPLPWIAAELGWIVAEYGRQPWAIEGILPTFLGVSSVSSTNVLFSLIAFIIFYSTLAVIDIMLMKKYVKLGPSYIEV
ncbi:Cytochrome d ubiquinol oxidase subunit 1 [Rickettsiales bacterium Ac37b]|nr:Cytochrome d ubiquinol oxidase subunit 1 [Rickettsiales bacterium Ac37b]